MTDVSRMENTSNRIGPQIAAKNATRIGRTGPKRSYSIPPTGAKNAPIKAPGNTKAPARNALVPNDPGDVAKNFADGARHFFVWTRWERTGTIPR